MPCRFTRSHVRYQKGNERYNGLQNFTVLIKIFLSKTDFHIILFKLFVITVYLLLLIFILILD